MITLFMILRISSMVYGQIDLNKEYTIEELNAMLKSARELKNNNDLADVYFLLGQYEEYEEIQYRSGF